MKLFFVFSFELVVTSTWFLNNALSKIFNVCSFFFCIKVIILSSFEIYPLTLVIVENWGFVDIEFWILTNLIHSSNPLVLGERESSKDLLLGQKASGSCQVWFSFFDLLTYLVFPLCYAYHHCPKSHYVAKYKNQATKQFCYLPLPSPPQLLGHYAGIISKACSADISSSRRKCCESSEKNLFARFVQQRG